MCVVVVVDVVGLRDTFFVIGLHDTFCLFVTCHENKPNAIQGRSSTGRPPRITQLTLCRIFTVVLLCAPLTVKPLHRSSNFTSVKF